MHASAFSAKPGYQNLTLPARTPEANPALHKRVLITDDDSFVRGRLAAVLQSEGFVVDEAENGIKAVTRAIEHSPDLVLLDLNMPHWDGLTAMVDRFSHGSKRHIDTHVVQRPIEVRREPAHPVELHHEVMAHRDVDVDIHRWHFWSAFSFGRRLAVLPFGCLALQIGGVPYYYGDGIY